MAEWQNGLFGCFGNMTTCIMGYFVPCYVHGKNSEAVGDDFLMCCLAYTFLGVPCIFVGLNRQKIREQKNIEGSIIGDICIAAFCDCCVLIQQANEVNSMGMAQSMARE